MADVHHKTLDIESAERLEKEYDSALATRDNGVILRQLLFWFAIAFAGYHIYTAGFGTPVEHVHMGIHLAGSRGAGTRRCARLCRARRNAL